MSVVYPFRNARGPLEPTDCEICTIRIEIGQGFSVFNEGRVSGYVCEECFKMFNPDDHTDHVFLLNVN